MASSPTHPPLPPKPSEPLPSDCCGQGCMPCVQDIYEQELKTWKRECERIRRGVGPEEASSVLSPDSYSPCTLVAVRSETHDTNVYRCRPADGQVLRARPGQHLILKLETEKSSITRQYTILLPPRYDQESSSELSEFEVMIKLYPEGRASKIIAATWYVGQVAHWRGPIGGLEYSTNSVQFVVIFAVGTGVLPMIPVVESIVGDDEEEARVEALLGFRSMREVLAKQRWKDIAGYWNVKVDIFLSQDEGGDGNVRHFGEIHRRKMGPEDIAPRIERAKQRDTLFLVCGTTDFEKFVIGLLKASSIPECRIKKF